MINNGLLHFPPFVGTPPLVPGLGSAGGRDRLIPQNALKVLSMKKGSNPLLTLADNIEPSSL